MNLLVKKKQFRPPIFPDPRPHWPLFPPPLLPLPAPSTPDSAPSIPVPPPPLSTPSLSEVSVRNFEKKKGKTFWLSHLNDNRQRQFPAWKKLKISEERQTGVDLQVKKYLPIPRFDKSKNSAV